MEASEILAAADLSVCIVDGLEISDYHLMGAMHAAFIPSITLSTDPKYDYKSYLPEEYQPKKIVNRGDLDIWCSTIQSEIELYDEDFVDLEKQGEVEEYVGFLEENAASRGEYRPGTQSVVNIREMIMGDQRRGDEYRFGQAGAVGPGAHAHHMNFNQIWNEQTKPVILTW
jgi:hypothetical protein